MFMFLFFTYAIGDAVIEAIVFDIGSVLVPPKKSFLIPRLSKAYGLSEQEFIRRRNERKELLSRGTIGFENFWKPISTIPPYEAKKYWKDLYAEWLEKNKEVLEEHQNFLASLVDRGIRLGILSNTISPNFETVEESGLLSLFTPSLILVSYHIHACKPEKQVYDILKQRLSAFDIDPKNCLLVDNRQANIVAARRYGFQTFQFDSCSWESCWDQLFLRFDH